MFTLDQNTLFYFSLSNTGEPPRIQDWASQIPKNAKPGSRLAKQGPSDEARNTTPSLTFGSTRTSQASGSTRTSQASGLTRTSQALGLTRASQASGSTRTSQASEPTRTSVSTRSALTNNVAIRRNNTDITTASGNINEDETIGEGNNVASNRGTSMVRRFFLFYLTTNHFCFFFQAPPLRPPRRGPPRPTNNQLPRVFLDDNTWRKRVVTTLIRWAGIQPNPWIIPDSKIVDALEKICNAHYGDWSSDASILRVVRFLFIWIHESDLDL